MEGILVDTQVQSQLKPQEEDESGIKQRTLDTQEPNT